MAKSNKPVIWGTFAAGGTVAAFFAPVLVLLLLLVATGNAPAGLAYDSMQGFAANWIGKIVVLGVIVLLLWSQAHRLRITCFDFGLRMDSLAAAVFYSLAAAGSIATVVFLLRI
jgi:fumarate reductase subunit D